MRKPEIPADQSIGAWENWRIETNCGCRRRYYPCGFLAERFGKDADVSRSALKLICQDCGTQPEAALVSEPSPIGFPTARLRPGILRFGLPIADQPATPLGT